MKIRAAIYGFGNIGKYVLDTLLAEKDFTVVGIISKSYGQTVKDGVPVVRNLEELVPVDVVIICAGSRDVPSIAEEILRKGVCTVDSFDIHTEIVALRKRLSIAAEQGNAAAVISAGWDPGSDSVVRALLEVMAPRGITHTNFGPGMSMGHSVAAKAIPGVANALSMTIPAGSSRHIRQVYVQLAEGADFADVSKKIKADTYFAKDETYVHQVVNVDAIKDLGHGVDLQRKGVSGVTHNQKFSYTMSINNPALTAQVLVGAARAAVRQKAGCYTMIEIPVIDFLSGDREEIIHRLV